MKIVKVKQRLVSNQLRDPAGEIQRNLDRLDLAVPPGEIAVTVGSRGIDRLPELVRAVCEWLKRKGARPFVVPCMGSHGGATAEGQRMMLEGLSVTEQSVGAPIRASMETVRIGKVATGPVFMDRHCWEAAGVLVLNRVKPHTCFAGPYQSGLVKMMVVGMGKAETARTFHSAGPRGMAEMLVQMGRVVLQSGRIQAGLALLEDGCGQIAEVHALRPEEIMHAEPRLLDRYKSCYMPRLPADEINVLVVDRIGKTYSGSGMDTNVIGYRGIKGFEDLPAPRIRIIAALGLCESSQGNAFGVGLADFITRRLRDAIDERKTLINVLTTGEMQRCKIPATLPDDEALVKTIEGRFGGRRWMFISDTLHLSELYVSEEMAAEVEARPNCKIEGDAFELSFKCGRLQLFEACGHFGH